MIQTSTGPAYRRYCKTLSLKDDPQLIHDYKKVHEAAHIWPEIPAGMKQVGILRMEIYLLGTRLFMIMDTVPDFDHDIAMATLATLPRQQEWEAYVSRFQQTSAEATADEKWQLMEQIFQVELSE
ncbi:MAG: L-rhamnose mutarotase [Marinilabiliales bacterium]|nr:L-rhamnose mutarotase [Marinilabiliales bacterium]